MQRLALIMIALVLILGACQVAKDATGPNQSRFHPTKPAADAADNCTFDAAQCEIIRAGIEYLLNHANASCRDAGATALQRFEAPSGEGGYRDMPQQAGMDMGVQMDATSNTYSGWQPTSGYVDVFPSFWESNTDPQHAGSLVAHEEQHQNGMDGPYHNTGVALAWQDACMNPAA